jgi:hypothetical protein
MGNYKECHEMSQKIESFIRCLNNPVLYLCVGREKVGNYCSVSSFQSCVGFDRGGEIKECHEMSQKIESFIRCLNNPVLYLCVGRGRWETTAPYPVFNHV